MNTKLIAVLVVAIAVGAIAFFSAGSPSVPQSSTLSCSAEDSTLLSGSFTASQSAPYTFTVKVHNAESQEVRLASYTLQTQSYDINVAIAPRQNGTFTTVQDANSETWIPIRTSCDKQFMATSANTTSYTENIAPTSTSFKDSTQVSVDLQNSGNGTATPTGYYVTDSAGNEYALANWSGPSIAPNSVTTTIFSIGSSCSQCTLNGSAFTFTSGSQYTIRVVTGRGNTFTFAVAQTSAHHYSVVIQVGFGSTAH